MGSHATPTNSAPLDLSKWRNLPTALIGVGGVLSLIGLFHDSKQFAFSWLLAFMFFLSLVVGGLFLTILHHLFDASWSVPIRRLNEHLASLAPVMFVLFIPIALLAPKLYSWMTMLDHPDHALHAKLPLFTMPSFYLIAVINFAVWSFLGLNLRKQSLLQDKTGAAVHTDKMRFLSYIGIFLFAITVTLAAIMWMKALQHQWFSTMFGVWYFAGSTWLTLATIYLISMLLARQGPLKAVMKEKQFYFIGTLMFAFTVFHAYVTFSQYFIIWNANMPEETFWYLTREKGTWFQIGVLIIIGHFFIPFLALIRIDVKHKPWWMIWVIAWAWIMHFVDLSFNIVPVIHPDGFVLHWNDLAAFAFIGGVLAKVYLKQLASHPYYPQRDPRLAEGLDVYVPPATVSGAAGKAGH